MPPQTPMIVPTSIPLPSVAYTLTMTVLAECTIPAGTAISTPIDMTRPERLGYLPLLVCTPSAWDSAKLTLQISYDNTVWHTVYKWFDNKSFTTDHNLAADMAVLFDNYPLRGCPFFRFLSGTPSVPVNQTASRLLRVNCGTH